MNNFEAALAYSEKGFSVIPIRPDKKPFIQWTDFQKRRATKEEIKKWFSQWPKANVGIVTGKISGVFVIDCDSQEAYEKIQAMLPECFLTAIVKTPRGYHLYFAYASENTISNAAGILPGVDIRGDGGYAIAPPSVNTEGKAYSWMPGLSIDDVAPAAVPAAIYNIILNNSINNRGGFDKSQKDGHMKSQQVTQSHIFNEGTRDENLFHIALCLANTGNSEDYIRQTLAAIMFSWGEHDETWINTKVQSAFKRIEKKEKNIAEEVRRFLEVTEGHFQVTDCHTESQLVTKEDKHAVIVELQRLCKAGIIEKYGDRRGCYRKIENDVEIVDFLHAPTDDFPLALPLGVSDYCKLYPGNIVIVAGSKSAGKTAFLLNTVKENMHRHEIVYLNSEMGDTEFRKRLELFGDPLTDWKLKAYHRSSGFSDLITSERKIFIVDFLEVTTDFWKVGGMIQEIHKKLKDGIAIIALQKADGRDAGRGGDFSKEKSRLYLSLDYLPEQKVNRIKIVDAKAWRTETNPRGMYRHYKLANGSKFFPASNWEG
ncbi:MAG TPA: hypothetical protein DCR95_04795 [Desulfobacter sp.]|nr:hypothetical protein [Desulfobacter sp.]